MQLALSLVALFSASAAQKGSQNQPPCAWPARFSRA